MELNSSQVTVMLPVRDLARARDFYERALALPAGEERVDGKVVYHCGGCEVALFPKAEGTRWPEAINSLSRTWSETLSKTSRRPFLSPRFGVAVTPKTRASGLASRTQSMMRR